MLFNKYLKERRNKKMSKKLNDFDLDLVATKGNDDGASPASLTWISASSEPCAQATVSLNHHTNYYRIKLYRK